MVDPFEGRVALNYRIVGKLGQGAFGSVYRARHVELGREVAIKILLPQHAAKPDLIERFVREARVVCDIGHPDIVAVENAGRLDTGEPFYMMELVEGRSLARVVAEDGPLSPARFVCVFAPLASALAAAHDKRVVHRDLKPQNVMLRERAGEIIGVKLLDFGIAKFLHEVDGDSHTGDALGTPHYMAPEQVSDAKRVDARADIYAFAGTAFFALSGQRPVSGDSVAEVMHNALWKTSTRLVDVAPQWGAALSDAIARGLAKDPAQRPATVREAWALMQAAIAQRTTGEQVFADTMTARSAPAPIPSTIPPPPGGSRAPIDDPSSVSTRTPMIAGDLASMATQAPRRGRRLALAMVVLGAGVLTWVVADRVTRHGEVVTTAPPAAAVDAATPTRIEAIPEHTIPASVADAAPPIALVPVAPVVPDAGVAVEPRPKRSRHPSSPGKNGPAQVVTPPTVVPVQPAPPAPPAPGIAAASCTREHFAKVYQAESPSRAQVNDALRTLKACYEARYIDAEDYGRIQAALIAKM